MAAPGFKVVHVQDIDYRSTCQPLTGCLQILRGWSKQLGASELDGLSRKLSGEAGRPDV
jgi:hypothetical protein